VLNLFQISLSLFEGVGQLILALVPLFQFISATVLARS
jgi:hypothetical protein